MKKKSLEVKEPVNLDYKDTQKISIIFGKMWLRKIRSLNKYLYICELGNLQYSKYQINDLLLLDL